MSEPYDPEEPLPPYDSDTDPDDGTTVPGNISSPIKQTNDS